jgi:hypothetical protein
MARGELAGRTDRAILTGLLLLGLALRVGVALGLPNIVRGDEIFQTLEPAYRLVHGVGVVAWEWRLGIRSWLLPGVFAPVIAVAGWLGLGPGFWLGAIAALLSAFSLVVVALGWRFGAAAAGREGAILAAGLGAVWFDLILFAPKALSETVGAHVMLIGAWYAWRAGREADRRAAWLAGVFLGLAFVIRFHLGPALAVAALYAARTDWHGRWPALLAGAALPVAGQAVLDWASWGAPLQSVWLNLWVNLGEGRSEFYGTQPFYWYPGRLLLAWGPGLPPVLVLALLGARRLPMLGAMALVHLAAHSLIAHKEMRFLYPAAMLLPILAGIGAAELLRRLRLSAWVGLAGFAALSLLAATGENYRGNFQRMAGGPLGAALVRAEPELCGLGLLDHGAESRGWWIWGGGYVHLGRHVPMSLAETPEELPRLAGGYNYALLPRAALAALPGFETLRCWPGALWEGGGGHDPDLCVARRPGTCAADAAHEINAVLKRQGN